jgi:hypothetical protein
MYAMYEFHDKYVFLYKSIIKNYYSL